MPKIIHQIWLQGEDNINPDLVEFKESVITHNSDYQIMYWDYNKLTKFVKEKRPDFIERWNSVVDENQALIKFTDISRWLLLYEYGGFYLDRDIKVYKSLNLLYDRIDKPIGFAMENIIKDRYIQTPMGYKLYSKVKKRYSDYVLQDCFSYAEPKQEFFNQFLEYCFKRKSHNIFDSFSVWALTDFVNENKFDIYLFNESDVLYGNDTDGISHHFLFHGWADQDVDEPWKSEPKNMKKFNLYKI